MDFGSADSTVWGGQLTFLAGWFDQAQVGLGRRGPTFRRQPGRLLAAGRGDDDIAEYRAVCYPHLRGSYRREL